MSRKFKLLIALTLLLILAPLLALLLLRHPTTLTFDLRDGSRLELISVSVGTNHVAHFGTLPQKALFKIVGTRLSEKWVGRQMVTPSQDVLDGNLGVFVRHHLPPGEYSDFVSTLHNYKIKPTTQPHPIHSMFLSSGAGEHGLWELVYWTTNHSTFLIENSKGEHIGRFQIGTDSRGRHTILQLN